MLLRRFSASLLLVLPVIVVSAAVWRLGSASVTVAVDLPSEDPVRVLILTGVSNAAHDWKATTSQLQRILENSAGWSVQVCDDPEHKILATEEMEQFDVVILNFARPRRWAEDVEEGFCRFLQAGKGAIVLHAANNSFGDWPQFEHIVGGAWRAGSFHPPYGPFIVYAEQPEHPILNGIERFEVTDELYCNLRYHPEKTELLAYAMGPGTRQGGSRTIQPIAWTTNWQDGRVFHLTLGHDVAAMSNRNFVRLIQRGTLWCTGRLNSEPAAVKVVASTSTP